MTALPVLAFNRGIISKLSLARVDLARTRLSAEIMTNWLPKTQGAMIFRPGTKYVGSSLNDTGAQWIEFVAATDDAALLELTDKKMRVWIDDALLGRPAVDTTISLSDTGWEEDNQGGGIASGQQDIIPVMLAATTNGVTISTSSEYASTPGWHTGDDDNLTRWQSNGIAPQWVSIDFGSGVTRQPSIYTIQAAGSGNQVYAPKTWRLLGSQHDTGTYATDTGKWHLEDAQSDDTGWGANETRSFTLTDTGTADAWRHLRLYVAEANTPFIPSDMHIAEIEVYESSDASGDTGQTLFNESGLTLNAGAVGSTARVRKKVVLDTGDQEIEHSFDINVTKGPVRFRCGSSSGEDDYVSETVLNTGYHNLAFTPVGDFHVTVQATGLVGRNVGALTIGDSGTVEITSPWEAADLDKIRYDQSADVVFVDADGYQPYKIERRGTGRSWSVVELNVTNGPFRVFRPSTAKLSVDARYGAGTMTSNIPYFREGHVGSLFRIEQDHQDGEWRLGYTEATTDVIAVTGLGDTGTPSNTNERRITFSITGTYQGEITVERSLNDPEFGYSQPSISGNYSGGGGSGDTGYAQDTGTFTVTVDDQNDNTTVYFRARLSSWTSGVAVVNATYSAGSTPGIAKVTKYTNNSSVEIDVVNRFARTNLPSDGWQEGAWSGVRGYPTSIALHAGRLFHAGYANLWGSVPDDYENHDDTVEGESGPINRVLGSGPVDAIQFIVSLLRLVMGTDGQEYAVSASAIDESLTPTNASARVFSTQGSSAIRAVKIDNRGIFVQRSGQRVYMVGFGENVSYANEYDSSEMTILVPELLQVGIVSIAVQRQPDTRIHCVLADGTVAILTFEPKEEVLAWSKWVTDTGTDSAVEKAMVLPGPSEDSVYYHIKRTINGTTKRFLERWAKESEIQGDTGLSWLVDCAVSYTDTGAATTISDFAPHLGGQTIAAWANDTGQDNSYGKDLTPDDTGGDPVLLSVDTGGDLTLNDSGWKHVVGGLPYAADFKSAKLAYSLDGQVALAMMKRVSELALVLSNAHNNGIFFGGDSGNLDPMPRVNDEGAQVDADKIFDEFDEIAFPFNGLWDEDSRVHLRAKSPRPVTVLALIPKV